LIDLFLTIIAVLVLMLLAMEHLSKKAPNSYNIIFVLMVIILLICFFAGGMDVVILVGTFLSAIIIVYAIFK